MSENSQPNREKTGVPPKNTPRREKAPCVGYSAMEGRIVGGSAADRENFSLSSNR